MTPTSLKTYTLKDLAQLAKKHGVHGWHSMRKEQLVQALVRSAKRKTALKTRKKVAARSSLANASRPAASASRPAASASRPTTNAARPAAKSKSNGRVRPAPVAIAAPVSAAGKSPRMAKRLEQAKARIGMSKNLSNGTPGEKPASRDRLVVMVRGPYWLHACWELQSQSVTRASAAMGQDWHTAKPVLRVMNVSSSGTTSNSERVLRDIEIHGGVRNWYIDVKEPAQTYRLEIGYLAASGKFFSLGRSNVVSTPAASSSEAMDSHWTDVAEQCDKIYAMSGGFSPDTVSSELQELFEERLRRPMGSPMVSRYGMGAEGLLPKQRDFEIEIDAELIIYGATQANAYVTLMGEPVRVQADGSFTARLPMPNRRQVIPVVASSRDGGQQRTIVLAVERNTKAMEPVTRDSGD